MLDAETKLPQGINEARDQQPFGQGDSSIIVAQSPLYCPINMGIVSNMQIGIFTAQQISARAPRLACASG